MIHRYILRDVRHFISDCVGLDSGFLLETNEIAVVHERKNVVCVACICSTFPLGLMGSYWALWGLQVLQLRALVHHSLN